MQVNVRNNREMKKPIRLSEKKLSRSFNERKKERNCLDDFLAPVGEIKSFLIGDADGSGTLAAKYDMGLDLDC